METWVLSIRRRLLLVIACNVAMRWRWWRSARKGIKHVRELVLRKIVRWCRGRCSVTLYGGLRGHVRELLRIHHHLMIRPLCELGVGGVKVGGALRHVWVWLLGRMVLVECWVKWLGRYRRLPGPLRLLVDGVWIRLGRLLRLLKAGWLPVIMA